jgi:hypothetical protein
MESMTSILYFPKTAFSKRFGKQFFTVEIEKVEVINEDSCWNKHAVYTLLVKQGKAEWSMQRRFREFDNLLKIMKTKINVDEVSTLPCLPPKTCFPVTDDEKFLEDRKDKLYGFLDSFLKELSQKNLVTDKEVLDFLGLDPNFKIENS